ncbi:hypothetical protein SLEP1_g28509 [Rubroshorea leprosula]|uniref:peptidylprolyl isomerase n=1 Tax=Rubroshorea leprosula TaxID=152421 RepID=A0AAV5K4R6_9ROSI|nr:hypothetical protein SLEP1_g28509 [Rubroshorea leprosula]
MAKKKNPLVFMDVSIDGDPGEKMVFELFPDFAPKTAENFRALCTGEKGIGPKTGKALHYKGSFFHHIMKGSMAKAGDFVKRDGTSGESIYEVKFPGDELAKLKHDGAGLLSMPVSYRDSIGSQFIITLSAAHHLDRKSVIFGKLVQGDEVLKKIENVGDEEGRPTVKVKIINCGEFIEDKKKIKSKIGKDACPDANSHEARRKGKHKKSSKDRRKKRRRYYSSDSESSSDSETESSESDTNSDSSLSSSSEMSSSSDDRHKKRKRSSKREKHRRGKRRDGRRDRKRKRRDKRSKRRSRRASDSMTDDESESKSETSTDNGANVQGKARKHKELSQKTGVKFLMLGVMYRLLVIS